jgi:hypothetical protein
MDLRVDTGAGAYPFRDPVAIADYLGPGAEFEKSITDSSERYADQNEQDYQAFVKAIRSGPLPVVEVV